MQNHRYVHHHHHRRRCNEHNIDQHIDRSALPEFKCEDSKFSVLGNYQLR
jgi:hypothetical protein